MGEFWNIVLKIMTSVILTFSSSNYERAERRPGNNEKILARITFIQDNYEEAIKLDNLQLNEIKNDEIKKKRERFEEELQVRKNIEKETAGNEKQSNRGDEEELWGRLGDSGRLVFDNGWSVALNYVDYDGQAVTDAWDSAAYMDFGIFLIADHANQGFSVMKQYGPGSTAKILRPNGTTEIIQCISYYPNAYWNSGDVYLPDGSYFNNHPGNYVMQTCNNSAGTSVSLSYWNTIFYD